MITIPSFLFQSIPEALVYIAFTIALVGLKVRRNIIKVLFTGFIVACIAVVLWFTELPFFARLLLQIPLYWLIVHFVFRYPLYKVMVTVTIGYGVILMAETISIEMIILLTRITYDDIIASNFLRIVTPSGGYVVLIIATWLMNTYNWSLFRDSVGITNEKIKSNKKIDFYILALTIQMLLVVFLNLGITTGLFKQSNLLIQGINLTIVILTAALLFYVQYIVRLSEKAGELEAQKSYIKNVNDLFVTIRGQRHDFVNHVQVLHSYTKMGKYDKLLEYINCLTDEVKEIGKIIVSDNATLSALLQTKSVMFETYNINLDLGITSNLTKSQISDIDQVKLIGNLLDNAKEAIVDNDVEKDKRKVSLRIFEEKGTTQVVVGNLQPILTEEEMKNIFTTGYTTKKDHTGIGLSIVKQMIEKYDGQIDVVSSGEYGTVFTVVLPNKVGEGIDESNSKGYGESHSKEFGGTSIS